MCVFMVFWSRNNLINKQVNHNVLTGKKICACSLHFQTSKQQAINKRSKKLLFKHIFTVFSNYVSRSFQYIIFALLLQAELYIYAFFWLAIFLKLLNISHKVLYNQFRRLAFFSCIYKGPHPYIFISQRKTSIWKLCVSFMW